MAKFSIGIDLGTTNCAMACVALDVAGAQSEVVAVPQWHAPGQLAEPVTLPSFLYLPTAEERSALHPAAAPDSPWVPGELARERAAETPGRVVHSAKSWLGHHAVDRSAAILPWGSEVLAPTEKVSPLDAAAMLLGFLRATWNRRMGARGSDYQFDAQQIVITVPASFDVAAQGLTMEAARKAGFPPGVRLLEEPQAAFYRWLECHHDPQALWSQLPRNAATHHVLVIDIGGGTSDFSLFAIDPQDGGNLPSIRRVAVSEHILLGGDNIDLALAHLIEPRLAGGAGELAGSQWADLVARCRALKEQCLASAGAADEAFPITLAGRGASLFGGARSASVTRGEIEALLLDGFFPACAADARPATAPAGLLEMGLPYAADSAITRYLAEFLAHQPPVDAILFNGGTLRPAQLQHRLRELIGQWQAGQAPTLLDNPEPDLAVARGAARFASLAHHHAGRIEAGAARAIYLEVQQPGNGPALVCVLPRGAAAGRTYLLDDPPLELRVNQPVRFQAFAGHAECGDPAGTLTTYEEDKFHRLPPLQTVAQMPSRQQGARVAVTLAATLSELGVLELECRGEGHRWPVVFNLRGALTTEAGTADAQSGVAAARLAAAGERIVEIFSKPLDRRDLLTANRLFKSLEELLGLPKAAWDVFLIRQLWTSLRRCLPCRANSLEHEETWLILAGFLLRPGFGASADPQRIDELWQLHTRGLAHPTKQIQLQQFILWRRVAGGLDRARQHALLDPQLPRLTSGKPSAELVRMAGAFERLDQATKEVLVRGFLGAARAQLDAGATPAAQLAALGQLLGRMPLYAGAEAVVPATLVGEAFDALGGYDWQRHPELADLFLGAARVTNERAIDLPKPLRRDIARKLEGCSIAAFKIQRVEQFIPLDRAERAKLFGEALPAGLVFGKAEAPD